VLLVYRIPFGVDVLFRVKTSESPRDFKLNGSFGPFPYGEREGKEIDR